MGSRGKSNHLYLALDLSRNASNSFLFNIMLAEYFSCTFLIVIWSAPSIPKLFREFFCQKKLFYFEMFFIHLLLYSYGFLVFNLLLVYITFILHTLTHPCRSGRQLIWYLWMIFLCWECLHLCSLRL